MHGYTYIFSQEARGETRASRNNDILHYPETCHLAISLAKCRSGRRTRRNVTCSQHFFPWRGSIVIDIVSKVSRCSQVNVKSEARRGEFCLGEQRELQIVEIEINLWERWWKKEGRGRGGKQNKNTRETCTARFSQTNVVHLISFFWFVCPLRPSFRFVGRKLLKLRRRDESRRGNNFSFKSRTA